jgi:hypothetical protein
MKTRADVDAPSTGKPSSPGARGAGSGDSGGASPTAVAARPFTASPTLERRRAAHSARGEIIRVGDPTARRHGSSSTWGGHAGASADARPEQRGRDRAGPRAAGKRTRACCAARRECSSARPAPGRGCSRRASRAFERGRTGRGGPFPDSLCHQCGAPTVRDQRPRSVFVYCRCFFEVPAAAGEEL